MTEKKYAIVGGGIGGLTLAIAMQRKGFNVKVYENASHFKPLGAGLALASNAVKAFQEIGIGEAVLKAGKVMKMLSIKDTKGNILSEINSVKISSKIGTVNNFTIHRADLHEVLFNQVQPETVVFNKGCTDYTEDVKGITLKFKDGTTALVDYVIACDGVHSVIRKKLLPKSNPRYAGYTCVRAVINQVPSIVDMNETSETWGPGHRFGIVPLNNNRLYWFACINADENDSKMREVKIENLLAYFNNFHSPVKDILRATTNDQLIWNDIIDIKPLKKFAFGKIVLMGDAAHATTPNMGQGACMTIEDAAVLSNCLTQNILPEEAFIQFEKKQIKRTTTIVNHSWNFGRIAQLQNPLLMRLRNTAIRLTPSYVSEKQIKFLADVSFR